VRWRPKADLNGSDQLRDLRGGALGSRVDRFVDAADTDIHRKQAPVETRVVISLV